MTEEQLNKLLNHQFAKFYGLIDRRLDEVRNELRTEITTVRDRVDSLHSAVDSLAAQVENASIDNHARDAQIDRHDQAITRLADHTGLRI